MNIAVLCPFKNTLSIGYAEGVIEHLMRLKINVFVDASLLEALGEIRLKNSFMFLRRWISLLTF